MLQIIANIISLFSSSAMVISGIMKTKGKILFVQGIQLFLSAVSKVILGGISGAIINLLSIARNIFCYKEKLDFKLKIILTVLSVALPFIFGEFSVFSVLPTIASILWLWLMTTEDIVKLKIIIATIGTLWLIYDFSISLYTGVLFDVLGISANLISAYKLKKNTTKNSGE